MAMRVCGSRAAGQHEHRGADRGVILAGNRIGTNAEGTDTVPNGSGTTGDGSGVLIEQNAALNFVFGNVIAANEGDGVRLSTGEVDFPNLVAGNFIGLPNPVDLPSPLGLTAEKWGNLETGVYGGSVPAGQRGRNRGGGRCELIGFNRCGTWSGPDPDIDDGGIAVTSGSDGTSLAGISSASRSFRPAATSSTSEISCDGIKRLQRQEPHRRPSTAPTSTSFDANAEDGSCCATTAPTATRSSATTSTGCRSSTWRSATAVTASHQRLRWQHHRVAGEPRSQRDRAQRRPRREDAQCRPAPSTPRLGNLLQRNKIFDNALLGIDLDDPQDAANIDPEDASRNTAADPTTVPGDAPHAYANWRQNAPILCTGGGGFPCVDGGGNPVGAAPGYSGGTTTVMWSLATAPGPISRPAPEHRYRVEFFSTTAKTA